MRNAMWMQGVEWLAAAAPDPQACKREWERGAGTVLLEAGRHWDVVSVPRQLGLLALDILWYDPLQTPGPTLVDSAAHRVGFFVPPDPAGHWTGADVRHASKGSWVAAPPPYRSAGSVEWIVPPDGSGTLHPPLTLELALRQANETLAVLAPVSTD
ncbi:hypothetical protein ACWDR2_38050 [Streptomyces sp. NPDC003631]|uniref:hypothetical protein n=1 Tax=unclassified Streptomyces TaxID=2593676 RepID=UPI001104A405|nr:hypothetical protein [Streptomyces sp. WAC07094]TFV33557.1 hypothetical protein E4K10_36290 [Streptomyces sp. T1317-0309]